MNDAAEIQRAMMYFLRNSQRQGESNADIAKARKINDLMTELIRKDGKHQLSSEALLSNLQKQIGKIDPEATLLKQITPIMQRMQANISLDKYRISLSKDMQQKTSKAKPKMMSCCL